MRREVDIRAFADPARMGVSLYASSPDGRRAYTASWVPQAPEAERPALLRLSLEDAQLLMDSLWEAGLRPAGAAGSVGQAKAMEAHIADLRKTTTDLARWVDRAVTAWTGESGGGARAGGGAGDASTQR